VAAGSASDVAAFADPEPQGSVEAVSSAGREKRPQRWGVDTGAPLKKGASPTVGGLTTPPSPCYDRRPPRADRHGSSRSALTTVARTLFNGFGENYESRLRPAWRDDVQEGEFALIRDAVDSIVSRSLAPLSLRTDRRSLTVLAYHDVVDVETFTRQIEFLCAAMVPISADQFVRALNRDEELPDRAVLVTFDDGSRTVLERALPVLRTNGVPAVAFVTAGLLDTDTPFWWKEVEDLVTRGATIPELPSGSPTACVAALKAAPDERRLALIEKLRGVAPHARLTGTHLRRADLVALQSAGVEIGNHTQTHPCLNRCDTSKIEAEIAMAHENIADALGGPPRLFAYPNGDHVDHAERVLSNLGYQAAFLFDHRKCRRPFQRYRVSRLRVNSTNSMHRFRSIVSGVHPFLHGLIGRRGASIREFGTDGEYSRPESAAGSPALARSQG
jgi:peptidoglycan/xylan/chitin deacetylase (PgdA/CDA1 family)